MAVFCAIASGLSFESTETLLTIPSLMCQNNDLLFL